MESETRGARSPLGGAGAEGLGALAGVASFALGLAGLIVWEGPADRPELDAPPSAILDYFGQRDTVIAGGFLLMLSALAFLWFAGSLRAVLRRAEGDTGHLSAIAYAGGVIAVASILALPASNTAGALFVDQLSPDGARTFYLFGDVFLYPAAMGAAALAAASAAVSLRTAALPRWLAWLSFALALWLLIPPLGTSGATQPENPAWWTGLAIVPAVPLWAAVTGVVLMRNRRIGR